MLEGGRVDWVGARGQPVGSNLEAPAAPGALMLLLWCPRPPATQTLTKRYIVEPEDDIIPKQFIGCEINWKDVALNPTVEQVTSGRLERCQSL